MNRLLSVFLVLFLISTVFAQTRKEMYDMFDSAASQRDSAAVASLIVEWEKSYPDDAELFSVRANYYYMNAVKEMVALSQEKPTDGREYYVMKDSLGEEVYMYSVSQVDSARVTAAQAILADGIARHPHRIDLRLGKVALHLKMKENALAVQELASALEQSVANQNKWTGALDEPIETEGISYLRDCVQTYFVQLINDGDLATAEKMIDASIRHYPQDAIFLTDKGTARFLSGDLPSALQWCLSAREHASDDVLITNNIANIYEKMGDKQNALKYYRIVADSNSPEYSENAKLAVKELSTK